MDEQLFFKVSKDEYELPIGVCSRDEAPDKHGLTKYYIGSKKLSKNYVILNHYGRSKCKLDSIWTLQFYDRVGDLIKAMGETRVALAKKYHVNRKMFTHNGDAAPSCEKLLFLAKALNTSTDYLLGLTDDPTPYRERKKK